MNRKIIGLIAVFLLIIGGIIGAAVFLGRTFKTEAGLAVEGKNPAPHNPGVAKLSKQEQGALIQEELNDLSSQMVADLQAERRLDLGMVAQLRAYRQMLGQIQEYAQHVEKQIDGIEEISKDEFQEDVKLQASLFTGKKADLVAKHLEEFRASRVGAILAKMKEKEASAVLDVWAKKKDPRVSAFYREAMASYLNNRRRDMHPELFNKLQNDKTVAER